MLSLKDVYLRYVVGYKNPERYWNARWRNGYLPRTFKFYEHLKQHLSTLECETLLDVGCGLSTGSECFPADCYMGLDFSKSALMRNPRATVHADVTGRLCLPEKSFDAVCTRAVLLHIPPSQVAQAARNIKRLAGKAVLLANELDVVDHDGFHCFRHDVHALFNDYAGKVLFLDGYGDLL